MKGSDPNDVLRPMERMLDRMQRKLQAETAAPVSLVLVVYLDPALDRIRAANRSTLVGDLLADIAILAAAQQTLNHTTAQVAEKHGVDPEALQQRLFARAPELDDLPGVESRSGRIEG